MSPNEIKEYSEMALSIIGLLSVVAAITPNPIDNVVLIALKKALDFGAFNWLSAENKRKPGEK